jgi:hypothetical protein
MPVPVIVTMPPPPPPDDGDDDRRVPPELTATVAYNPAGGLTEKQEARATRIIRRMTDRFLEDLAERLED